MADDNKSDSAADDAKGGKALDKLLKGLDAMVAKLDSMGARLAVIERKDADEPPPAPSAAPPPPPKAPPPVEGEGEPVPAAADIKKDAGPPPPMPAAVPPPPAPPAKDALPPEFLENKKGEGDPPPDDKAADSTGDLNLLRKRLAQLEARMPKERSDHDLAVDQAAADSVYSLFGEAAPRPLIGDSRASYVLRNLEKFKVHSPAWKEVDLTPISVDEKVLNIAAQQIYAAARDAASSPASVPEGTLRAVTTRTPTGHIETRFMGTPAAWMSNHAPNRRFVTAINLKKGD